MPYPLEVVAMVMVLSELRSPPPVSPLTPVIVLVLGGTARLVLAWAAVLPPVPPSATANGVIPEIAPPVMVTELAFCTDIVPTVVVAPEARPRLILACAASLAPVPPSAIAKSTIPVILPPEIETDPGFCVAMSPSPRLVLAPVAVLAPVPPSATAKSAMPVIDPPEMLTIVAS